MTPNATHTRARERAVSRDNLDISRHGSPGFATAEFIAASLPYLPTSQRKEAGRLILRNLIAGLRAKGDSR